MSSSAAWLSTQFINSTSSTNQVDADSAQINSLLQDLTLIHSVESRATSSDATGYLAPFVFLVSGLEQALHDEDPLFLDPTVSFAPSQDRTPIGDGTYFRVERAEWNSRVLKGKYRNRWGKSVALKYSYALHESGRPDPERVTTNWRQLLSEVRALLHEPIRYHPNIVRLLGLSWSAVDGMRGEFPALVLELSELGTLADLQTNSQASLPFTVKKKLCWDVAKGISILHSCGVVHGDLKHENVLIYPIYRSSSSSAAPETVDGVQKYVAKISDFGGSVMDLQSEDFRSLHTPTRLWAAPEFFSQMRMSEEELKLTDVYSLGLLVWRTIMDGGYPYLSLQSPNKEPLTMLEIYELKKSGELLKRVKESVLFAEEELGSNDIGIVNYVFDNTMEHIPMKRNLIRSIAGLQADTLIEIEDLLRQGREANERHTQSFANDRPGERGVTKDSAGIYLAKMNDNGGDYDYQKEGPGFRPHLGSPEPGDFLFEPHRLKTILSWDIQVSIVRDLEAAALRSSLAPTKSYGTQITPIVAAFYLFKCHCYGFGFTNFDPVRACYWLKFAALCDDDCIESYLSRAWCWRVHTAFGVPLDVDSDTLKDWMQWSIIRGHRKCIAESESIIQHLPPISRFYERDEWEKAMFLANSAFRGICAGVGMPYFAASKLRRDYDMNDLGALDRDIEAELAFRGVSSIDDIYVNHRGDGLLNMAASLGKLEALKHLVERYKPNIDQHNLARYETALFSAVRGGHLACALYLLEQGAAPEGSQHCREKPLWWICSFTGDEIPEISAMLVRKGASLRHPGHSDSAFVRAPIRTKFIWADYEDLTLLPASPLSRAVMMESLPAVRALLALGADPLEGLRADVHPKTGLSVCPLVVAAVMTFPDILTALLDHLDKSSTPIRIFSEIEMLEMALDLKATMTNPLSLENRVTRHGMGFQSSMMSVLQILHEREKRFRDGDDESKKAAFAKASAAMIYRLVSLGQEDIVKTLLSFGHLSNTVPGVFPIVAAVEENNESIFRSLLDHGADIMTQYEMPYSSRKRSLLQVSAERPRQSKPGLGIARLLLERGVPVDPVTEELESRSAFCSAVRRQDFDLADLLLEHGADIDFLYIHKQGSSSITIFGEIICTPSERNLDSLEYLLHLPRPPKYIVSPSIKFTIFHYAAMFDMKTNHRRLAQGQMVQKILSESNYSSDEVVGYHHPGGSPGAAAPFLAAVMANLEVVTAFLDAGVSDIKYYKHNGLTAVAVIESVLARAIDVSELPAQISNRIGKDKASQAVFLERYKLILKRLSELPEWD